ncbi:hypothetical protein BOTNAR_0619g00070 [Botryotinia narcissicola]|uniref:Uncharacterized protein n=1 Tax=Botryotinia narcissicola TaxID=278944 RepID=A0A4Z1HCJ1_9HELO|nr:hypothetical protein BOTNAR_0619g00070 [Botryotinia narcissicola]
MASPSPFFPFSFSISLFAFAKARFMREVNISGTGFLGRGTVDPDDKAETHASLGPGTKMNVAVLRRASRSAPSEYGMRDERAE